MNSTDDPLEASRLSRRLELFEAITVPSLANQTTRDFEFVVLVDRDVPGHVRLELDRILQRLPGTHIVDFSPSLGVERTHWLNGLVGHAPPWFLTTNLDDDDALSADFIESLQVWAAGRVEQGSRRIMIAGAHSALEWNAIATPVHPAGELGSWRRDLPVSAGLSILCRVADCDVSILALTHSDVLFLAQGRIEDAAPHQHRRIDYFLDVAGMKSDEAMGMYDSLDAVAIALMVNHLGNVQATRHMNPARLPHSPVNGGLDRFGIDTERAIQIAECNRLTATGVLRQAKRVYRFTLQGQARPSLARRLGTGRIATRRALSTYLANRRV